MSVYKQIGIYRITNVTNGNTYIGKTGMNFGDRWDCHRAKLRGGYHDNQHLQNAWDKYGENAFEFDIVEEVKDVSQLNELEIKYIDYYRRLGKCYNISDGGDGGYLLGKHMSEETKRKIGEKNRKHMTGRKLSAETREKMSKSQSLRYANWSDEERARHGALASKYASGYTWSDEAKLNFSKMQQERPNSAKYDIETVREIRRLHEEEGKSYSEISEMLNIARHTVYLIATYRRWKKATNTQHIC